MKKRCYCERRRLHLNRDSFLKGAFVLAVAGVVSRSLGAIYRFILPWFLENEALGLYQMAYPVYAALLSVSGTGIPIAISKLVSAKAANENREGVVRVLKIAFFILAFLGVGTTFLMYFGAAPFAQYVLKDPRAQFTIRAIAPALFFVSIMCAFRGFFQGLQWMTPHGVSQVVEQFIRVGTIIFALIVLAPDNQLLGAVGASFGAVTGAVAGLIYLTGTFFRHRGGLLDSIGGSARSRPLESPWEITKKIFALAIPVSLAGVTFPVINFIDSAVVPARLQVAGLDMEAATALYGVLSGKAMVFVNAPLFFTSGLALSLVPAISEAEAKGDEKTLRRRSRMGLRVSFVVNVAAAAGLFLLSREIPMLLWDAPKAGVPLAVLSGGVLFITIQLTCSGILQGLGRPDIPLRNLAVALIVKFAVTWFLTGFPSWNIKGAAMGSTLAFLVGASLNLTAVQLRIGHMLDFDSMILRPGAAVLIMGLAVKGSWWAVFNGLQSTKAATLTAILAGVFSYGVALLLVGGLKKSDLLLIPRVGPRLAAVLEKTGLLRD